MGCSPSTLRGAHSHPHPNPHPNPYNNPDPTSATTTASTCNTKSTATDYSGASDMHALHASRSQRKLRTRPSASRLLHSLSTLSLRNPDYADSMLDYDACVDKPARPVVAFADEQGRKSDEEEGKKGGMKLKLKLKLKRGEEKGKGLEMEKEMKRQRESGVGLPRRASLPLLVVAASRESLRTDAKRQERLQKTGEMCIEEE